VLPVAGKIPDSTRCCDLLWILTLKTTVPIYRDGKVVRIRSKSEDLPLLFQYSLKSSGKKAGESIDLPIKLSGATCEYWLSKINFCYVLYGRHRTLITLGYLEKYIKEILLLVLLVFTQWPSFSQSLDDTLEIQEVRVNYNNVLSMTAYKKTHIDSSLLAEYHTRNLSELLAENTHLFIKTYGQGGLATSSVRGAGASHTMVTWNGVNINSPMLGQLDFSLIPASFLDRAEVFYGAGSIRDYSGALGGSVNLINEPDWDNRLSIELSQELGSYHTKKSHLSTVFGNPRFQSQTRFFYNAAENNFTFLNTEILQDPVFQERKNASFSQGGIIQEFYLRPSSNHLLTARLWYQSNNRHLPEPMVVIPVDGNEKQKDYFLRSQINWKYYSKKVVVSTTAAWLYDFLNYSNHIAGIDSENRSQTITGKVDLSYDLIPELQLNSGVLGDYTYIWTENYQQTVEQKHFSIYFSAEKNIKQRLKINMMARQDIYNGEPVALIPSAGIDFKLLKKTDINFKANFSKNYHKPTLNDRYWYPGGNPDLNEEKGTSGELSIDYSGSSGGIFSYQTCVTAYRSKIDDWIQWQPGEYGYWEPVNLKEVLSKGIESFLSCSLNLSGFLLSLGANYAYTSATNIKPSGSSDMSVDKQLVYVPRHQTNAHIKVKTGGFMIKYSYSYTAKRYISSDNSQFMPSYKLSDLSLSYAYKKGSKRAEIYLFIENIWNIDYQAIAYHPMPGRSYFLSINFYLNKNYR